MAVHISDFTESDSYPKSSTTVRQSSIWFCESSVRRESLYENRLLSGELCLPPDHYYHSVPRSPK